MRLKEFVHYLIHPVFFAKMAKYKIYALQHPDEPWLSQGAVEFCRGVLSKNMTGLEWGSGRSTCWFGQRLKSLLSIEANPKWYQIISKKIEQEQLKNIELRYIPVEHENSVVGFPIYSKLPRYVKVIEEFKDESLDFVIVDGHYRRACILAILPKIKRGGYLLVDNADWFYLRECGIPSSWDMVHRSKNEVTETTIWQKP